VSAACATLPDVTTVPAPGQGGDPTQLAAAPALCAADLVAATQGTLLRDGGRPIRGGAVDSRTVQPGNLFVALPGERTDGHRFLEAAVAAGAAALLVSRPLDAAAIRALGPVSVVRVPDALLGLQAIGAAWRTRFHPLVIGITGSVAKTSTKDATAAVLSAALPTLKSEGNANNEIGLPLTLLRLGPEHRAAVLEMGMYVGGEIATLARLGRPEIGVVTSVAPVHQERAGSLAAIEDAKAELVEALPPGGTAVLNADDLRVRTFGSRTRASVIRYGLAAEADVTAERIVSRGAAGMTFDVVARAPRRTRFGAQISALGRHSVQNALAATAVGLLAGLPDEAIAAGLATDWAGASPHRGVIVDAPGLTILDDTYNASPPAVLAALEVLGSLPGRPVAILGEMLELGDAHAPGHRAVGEAVGRAVAELVVVGHGARGIAEGAVGAGLAPSHVHQVPDRASAIELLPSVLRRGDVLLVKASRGAALEEIVDALRGGIPA
jgi:UDP-N-acetylmuramoyl-tripeptide--D-alanyl-D-alanine ligase